MSQPYTGGCACGAIRYEIRDQPMAMGDCQCRDCQQRSGTGHGSYLSFASRAAVSLHGEAKTWQLPGDSGKLKSHAFCPNCGTPVYLSFPWMPELFIIHAASLDDPARYQPQMVFYTVRALAWDRVDPALTRFDKMPQQ